LIARSFVEKTSLDEAMRLARNTGGAVSGRGLRVEAALGRSSIVTEMTGAGVRPWRPNLDAVAGTRRRHGLEWVSGVVIDAAATHAASSRGGGNDPPSSSGSRDTRQTMTLHDELRLRDLQGLEHLFQLDDLQVAARRGDEVTVVWTTSRNAEQGPFIVVRNHTSADTYYDDEALLRLYLREPRGVLWTALLIVTCFTPLVLGVPWFLLQRAKARRAVTRFKDSLLFVH
jgi:hypothetical protein